MMNTIAALCITILFSVWVWSLKHALAEIEKRLSPAMHAEPEPMNVGSRSGHAVVSGTSTWTLE